MIFESHAHYDDPAFDEDREELLGSMREHGIEYIINVAASLATTESTIALTEQYPFIYGAAGVHPDDTKELNEERFAWLREQCAREKIVAVGEIGLDYYWDSTPREVQKKWFVRQLELAKETGLPVIIHSREAAQETFELIREHHAGTTGGVIHCFSYAREMAEAYVKLGYFIGVGGVVTFKNARKLKETVVEIPLTSIVLETDCPYLAPEPNRGKRNNSAYIRYVAEEIAKIKGITYEEVVAQTEENARKMYRL